jgi:hypothetical protein
MASLDLYLLDGTYQWKSPRTVQKLNKERFEALSPIDQKKLRDAGYNNRGRANIRISNTLLNKYHALPQPDTSKCKVKVTLEDSSTKWVEVSKGVFFYWDYIEFGGTYSRTYANEIANALQKLNPKLVVEVV